MCNAVTARVAENVSSGAAKRDTWIGQGATPLREDVSRLARQISPLRPPLALAPVLTTA
jgi:hypothetical protein